MTTLYNPHFSPGATVTGKWKGTKYRIERLLGEGANGKVYLVTRGNERFAMKMGFEAADHQSEVNVLRKLHLKGGHYRNYLLDVDDFVADGRVQPFYVMRWIRGGRLSEFLKTRGPDWIGLIGLNLLARLNELHRLGYVFGDLKADNLLISGYGDVELVDFGGVTALGRSVKQFTEFYDRGYWGCGSRVADEGYDLFSFAMVLLQCLNESHECFSGPLLPQNRSTALLADAILTSQAPEGVRVFLRNVIEGKSTTSAAAIREWRSLVLDSRASEPASPRNVRGLWLSICFTASAALFLAAIYYSMKMH